MISCPGCAWRYSRHVAREIVAYKSSRLYVMTIPLSAVVAGDFGRRRKAIHNAVSYQRRRFRQWRGVGIWGWHIGADIRGFVALDMIAATEFTLAFRRHGQLHLRPISAEEVRVEVYRAVRSIPPTLADQRSGRYQSLKIAITPMPMQNTSTALLPAAIIHPLPMLMP